LKLTDWPRTLVVTQLAPPSHAASARVIERLIAGVESSFSFVHGDDGIDRTDYPAHCEAVRPRGVATVARSRLWRLEPLLWSRPAVRTGLALLKRRPADVVVGWHPNLVFVAAAARVAAVRRLPFVLALCDLFVESRVNPVERLWARRLEQKLFKQAVAVVCLTEAMCDFYAPRWGSKCHVIPHSLTSQEIADAVARRPSLVARSPARITYAGGVYQARLDSLIAVKQAVDELNASGVPVSLCILGKNDAALLREMGLHGPYVEAKFVEDRTAYMDELRKADLLLSTIAFQSDYPLQDQTCFPTKTFDYFLAGKPVLVIAPSATSYAQYVQRHACGVLVDSTDTNTVAAAIKALLSNPALRMALVASGFAQSKANAQSVVQPVLRSILKGIIDKQP
jgi:glycosyltransferase involved in cell wall biosynthesis